MLARDSGLCYDTYNSVGSFRLDQGFEGTALYKGEDVMLIEVDFNSSEAIYIQLRNQIILGIATSTIQEGDSLPSVRQLAETVGVNMHTVNKAYNVLLDKRRGAVIALDADKLKALEEMREQLRIILAKGCCKNITREEVHELVDEIFEEYRALV